MFRSAKLKTVIGYLLTILTILFAGLALFACAGNENVENSPDFYRFEAERALFIAGQGATGTDVRYSYANSKSDKMTSNGRYLSGLNDTGDSAVWTFISEKDATADMYLYVASGIGGAEAFYIGGGNVITAAINGNAVTLPLTQIAAANEYCDLWQAVKISGVSLFAGYNHFSVEVTDAENRLNIDYLGVLSRTAALQEHTHAGSWNTVTVPAVCEASGRTDRICSDCKLEYHYLDITALGHSYSSFHYDDESSMMARTCSHCGSKLYADAPDSKYFGEVFENKTDYVTQKAVETVYEAEDAYICTDGGLNNGVSPIENYAGSSGGAHVGNISNIGNYIRFTLIAEKDCRADLALVLSNVLYTENGIGVLSPLSNYVSFTVNGENVDFGFVDFPGEASYNYYNWRYVLMKDIDLSEGENVLVFSPKWNNDNITIPNTDTLLIYTDEECVSPKRIYYVTDAFIDNSFTSPKAVETVPTRDKDEFTFISGKTVAADLVVSLRSQESLNRIAGRLTMEINGLKVKLEDLSLPVGSNRLVIKDLSMDAGKNVISFAAEDGIDIDGVRIYTDDEIIPMLAAEVDDDYNYYVNEGIAGAKVPDMILEAEDADLGSSQSSTGSPIIGESTTASGGKLVENFGRSGNSITWTFTHGAGSTADIAIRMACTNWNVQTQSNTDMIDLSRFITITVDGVYADLTSVDLKCSGPTSWTDWTTVAIKGVQLTSGEHTVVMTFKENNFPNTDVMYIYSGGS